MNWESFNWQTALWIGAIVLFIFFMMRGCGGMMGGCGMGGRRQPPAKDQNGMPSTHLPEKKE